MWSNKSLDHTTRQKDFAAAATATFLATGQFLAQGAIKTPFSAIYAQSGPTGFYT